MSKIVKIQAREVIDSRGFPTVEVELFLNDDSTGRAIVPSGASTGEGEALELRDGDPKRFHGKGVLKAIQNIREKIAPSLLNHEFSNQTALDEKLIQLDGTENKSKLGANAILPISMAFMKAQANEKKKSLYEMISSEFNQIPTLPVPLMNILNGGKHADNHLAIQEFMIVPVGFSKFSEALRAGIEIFHQLKKTLSLKNLSTSVGDEGGFAPHFEGMNSHEQALNLITEAIQSAGYSPGKDIFLALDAAASEFSPKLGYYNFEGQLLSSHQMIEIYEKWMKKFSIISIEDGLAEKDWEGWDKLTQQLGNQCQLVGDDLFVTNAKYLSQGIEKNIANSILIKLNQIGTVSETLQTMKMANDANYSLVTSHRSGETEDTFIADLAVGTGCGQIKTGSGCRTDRIAKYNELLRIEEKLGEKAYFGGKNVFKHLQKKIKT